MPHRKPGEETIGELEQKIQFFIDTLFQDISSNAMDLRNRMYEVFFPHKTERQKKRMLLSQQEAGVIRRQIQDLIHVYQSRVN